MKMIIIILSLLITTLTFSQSEIVSEDVSEVFNNQLAYVKTIYNTLDTAEKVVLNGVEYISFDKDSSFNYKVVKFCEKFESDSIVINSLEINGHNLTIEKLLTHKYMTTKSYSKNKKVRKSKDELDNINSFLLNHCEYVINKDVTSHDQRGLSYKNRFKKFNLDSRKISETITRQKWDSNDLNIVGISNRLLTSYLKYHTRTGHWKSLISDENLAITTYISYYKGTYVLLNYIELDGRKMYDNYYKSR